MLDTNQLLRRSWWILVAGLALGVGAAVALTAAAIPLFVSTSTVYISIRSQADPTSLAQGSQFARQQIAGYAKVATSPIVLQPVIAQLNLPMTTGELSSKVAASSPTDTTIISLSIQGNDPNQTTLIANTLADEFIKKVVTLEQPGTSKISPVRGTIIERASIPTAPISPRPMYNYGLGGVLGLIAGLLAAMARQSIDKRLHNRPELTDDLGVPVLGSLNDATQLPTGNAGAHIPTPLGFDDFRRLRAVLQQRLQQAGATSVLVTSADAGEGKSMVTAGLAAAFAEDGSRVLVLDADLREATLSRRLLPHPARGLSSLLCEEDQHLSGHVVALGSYDLVPAGEQVGNPSSLLTRRLLTPVLGQLQARYDVILIDSPSVAVSSDAARLAAFAGLTVMVVNTYISTIPSVREAVSAIDAAGGKVAGAVVNEHRRDREILRLGRRKSV